MKPRREETTPSGDAVAAPTGDCRIMKQVAQIWAERTVMRSDVNRRLVDLQPMAKEFNLNALAAAAELRKIEQQLAAMNVDFQVTLDQGVHSVAGRQNVDRTRWWSQELTRYHLGYGNVAGEWCLVARVTHLIADHEFEWDQDGRPTEYLRLRESPRAVQVAALRRIGDLLDLIVKRLNDNNRDVKQALDERSGDDDIDDSADDAIDDEVTDPDLYP